MEYREIDEVIGADGLRIVLLRGFPSPWGQAAKAMMEHKGLDFVAGALEAGGENAQVVAWSGTNSAPVVAWNDEPPLNRWDDILLLLEMLTPDKPLLAEDPEKRADVLGLSYLICGRLGFGWNYRLSGMHARAQSGKPVGFMGDKYGYNETDGAQAGNRVVGFLRYLTGVLESQAARGSQYVVGDSLTAADFYWAAFSNLIAIQPPEECPLDPAIRARFETVPQELSAAVTPVLIEHRDRIMHEHFKIPMEL